MVSNEPLMQELERMRARIAALEDFIAGKYADWPRPTPTGQTGSMTPAPESHLEGWIVPRDAPVNIRNARFVVPATAVYKLASGEARRVVDSEAVDGYVWFKLEDGNYARADVVTFSKEKPDTRPAAPINARIWPSPVTLYTITNTHYNHRNHIGIDLAASIGTRVLSGPNEGYVMKAFHCIPCGNDPEKQTHMGTGEEAYGYGLGNYIVVRYYAHPAENIGHFLYVLYAHLSKVNVESKQSLPPYTVIGEVGTSGNSSGPHLHIECRYSDNPLADFYAIRANEIDPSLIFSF